MIDVFKEGLRKERARETVKSNFKVTDIQMRYIHNQGQGRISMRSCSHADMTAQSFWQFRPKEQENLFFLKESFTYGGTKFVF